MENELMTVQNDELILTEEGIKQIKKFRKVKLQLDIMEEELKKNFKEVMEKNNMTHFETLNKEFKVTYVPETISKRFDSKKFKEDHEDLYNEYQIESKRSSYVRMS